MRQAILIKNPKWERFSEVLAEFKKSGAPVALVTREHAREKRTPAAKPAASKKLMAVIGLCLSLGLTFDALAQANITSYLPVTELAAASTNAGPGNGILGWNADQVAVLQLTVASTNNVHATTRSNVVVRFDASLNGTDWVANQYAFTAPTATFATNENTTILRMTNTVGAKWLRVGAVENGNTNRVYLRRFFWETKP